MAPTKGTKRAAGGAAPARPSKSAKATPHEKQLQAVAQALELAAGLPEACRAMLLAVLPSSLGTPKDARHAVQDHVIDMIGESLSKAKSEKEAASKEAAERYNSADARQMELQAALNSAEAALEGKVQATQEKQGALDSAAQALAEAQAALAAKKQEERAARESEADEQQRCAAFDAAVAEHFAPLKQGAWEDGAHDGERHLTALEPFLVLAELDGSVMASMRISGAKQGPERSGFDSMVLEQVGASLAEKAASLRRELEELAPGVSACSAAAATQAAEVEKAEAKVQECKVALQQAQGEQQAQEAKAKEAGQEHRNFAAETKKVAKARDAARAELDLFETGPLAAFEALRSATAKGAEAEAAQDETVTTAVGGA